MKTRHYIITGILAYILFLIAGTPATTIRMFDDNIQQVKLQGLGGSLWNGTAQRVTIDSKHILEQVSWSVCGWRLLTGELCVELDASYQDRPVNGQFGAGIGGAIRARNVTADIDAGLLGNLLQIPLGQLAGNVTLELESARWKKGSIPGASGLITWSDASITVAETAKLGTLTINVTETEQFPLAATIDNKGGTINIKGDANVIEDGTYKLELNLTPNNQASANVRKSLEMFAQQQPNGSFMLKNTGNLAQMGLM